VVINILQQKNEMSLSVNNLFDQTNEMPDDMPDPEE
jgi:hypothetical protein